MNLKSIKMSLGRQDDGAAGTAEENSAELKFPKEFEAAETLLVSEVHMLLEHRKQQNEQQDDMQELSEVFLKTLSYCQRMSRFKNRETIRAIRQLLTSKQLANSETLHKFEVSQLGNLCPETSEEAKSLIPSLENKLDDEELQDLLASMQTKKTFQ